MLVENSIESHKPVEIGDLRAQGDSRSGETEEGPGRPAEAVTGDPSTRKELFHETGRGG